MEILVQNAGWGATQPAVTTQQNGRKSQLESSGPGKKTPFWIVVYKFKVYIKPVFLWVLKELPCWIG